MNNYETIEFSIDSSVGLISLNRPLIHNAFNDVMIRELTVCFTRVNDLDEVRVVILRGNGKTFCSGADLNWMKDVARFSYQENYDDSYKLSGCFFTIYTCRKPTVAVVHGAAIGGANGLLAACDLAYSTDDTVFSLSEVKIGIVPACIGPYIIKRVGEYGARELMLTGERIDGPAAERFRLVNKSLPQEELDGYVDSRVSLLKTSGSKAMEHCKNLIYDLANRLTLEEAKEYTAGMIAEIRTSEEGQEGIAAFLEKRKPGWVTKKEQN